jgi:hypothetical protein
MKRYWWLIPLALVLAAYWQSGRPVQRPPGVLAPDPPPQTATDDKPRTRRDYTITPVADFRITARVLSVRRYSFGREADLSPVDFALGWGPMSNTEILEHFKISQRDRWYYWHSRTMPIGRDEVISHSANMHMIPASEYVADTLSDIREGHVIRIAGDLVNVRASDGWHWNTSTTRKDSGKGSCELIWVEKLEIVPPDAARN